MRFGQFVLEYLVAGLVVLGSVLLVGASWLFPDPNAGSFPASDLGTIPGLLVLVAAVGSAYPLGYLNLLIAYRALNPLGRRQAYRDFNRDLRAGAPELAAHLERFGASSGTMPGGYAALQSWERLYSLVRLKLLIDAPVQFDVVTGYWTRLSRAFAAFTVAFAVAGLTLLSAACIALVCSIEMRPSGSTLAGLGIFACLLSAVSGNAYLRLLKSEMKNHAHLVAGVVASSMKLDRTEFVTVFAYGSNMLRGRLQARTPGAASIGTGFLDGYEIDFTKRGSLDGSGKATVKEARRSDAVPGVLYQVPNGEMARLDAAEGGYHHKIVSIRTATGSVIALTYVADADQVSAELRPFTWYLDWVLAGAEEHDLPSAYRYRLSQISTELDPDEARHEENATLLRQVLADPVS